VASIAELADAEKSSTQSITHSLSHTAYLMLLLWNKKTHL